MKNIILKVKILVLLLFSSILLLIFIPIDIAIPMLRLAQNDNGKWGEVCAQPLMRAIAITATDEHHSIYLVTIYPSIRTKYYSTIKKEKIVYQIIKLEADGNIKPPVILQFPYTSGNDIDLIFFTVSPSGNNWWSLRNEFNKRNQNTKFIQNEMILALHSSDGSIRQEWTVPLEENELDIFGAISEQSAYVSSEEGYGYLYHKGRTAATKIFYKCMEGDWLESSTGIIWHIEYPQDSHPKDQGTLTIRRHELESSIDNTAIQLPLSTRAELNICGTTVKGLYLFQYNVPHELSLFDRLLAFVASTDNKKSPCEMKGYLVLNTGSVHRLFTFPEVYYPWSRHVAYPGRMIQVDAQQHVWFDFSTSKIEGAGEYQIVKVMHLPRWRLWWLKLMSKRLH